MQKQLGTIIIAALLSFVTQSRASASGTMFFPDRPTGVTLQTITGTLQSYGVGQQAGNVRIKTSDGTVLNFFVGDKFAIDGLVIDCPFPPHNNYTPPTGTCLAWPSKIVFGKTIETVTYWQTTDPNSGYMVNVTDELTTQK